MEFQGSAIFQVRRSIEMTRLSILIVLPGVMSPEGVLQEFWFCAGYATAVGLGCCRGLVRAACLLT
jgi:hypothetical protein